ncbi:hypothetical protein WJX84_008669 [Apatococcus fuscideae]|uniref:Uncharacterized protein n=1 Tax=Apatococcus fuscideae TaxID=2026836 RepID=A0AAW1S7A0_9CHLO
MGRLQCEVLICVPSTIACASESGATLLDHILKALEECGPAQPLPQNVWVVCSVATHTKLISKPWAPNTVADDHYVSVDCNTENLIDCLEAFTRSSAYARLRDASTLLILDACSICAWPSTLVRFMTHSLLRDEVCIARTREDTWAGPSAARDASSATRMPLATAVRASPATYLPGHAHRARQQHPVYSTSNNAYGSKAPSLHELPLSWHGIRGDFTRKQATGKVVTTGLKTAISNHAVADTLHELGL